MMALDQTPEILLLGLVQSLFSTKIGFSMNSGLYFDFLAKNLILIIAGLKIRLLLTVTYFWQKIPHWLNLQPPLSLIYEPPSQGRKLHIESNLSLVSFSKANETNEYFKMKEEKSHISENLYYLLYQ